MKKILLTLAVIIATITFAQAQIDWITYKIDDRLSVKLPTQPRNIARGVIAYSKDSLICSVSIIAQTDSMSLIQMIAKPGFVDGLKNAMEQAQKGLTLGDMNSSKWNGYYCYDVDGSVTPKKLKVSFHLIIIGGKIYALGAMMPENSNISKKNIFFDSVKLN